MTIVPTPMLLLLLTAALQTAPAQDPLDGARELYASAAYEEALGVLGKLETGAPSLASPDAEVLRAFCLLALRRDDEARNAIEDVVTQRPAYVPSEAEASPRVRDAFRDVRRKLLPEIARQLYASARDDYDKKNMSAAAAKFGDLANILADPDTAEDKTLADLRVLADGFRKLTTAMPPIATSTGTMGRANQPPAPAADAAAKPAAHPDTVGTTGTTIMPPVAPPVTPPVAIYQLLPPWHGDRGREFSGVLELIINEQGKVESATLRKGVHPLYDSELLNAARAWTYKPAMRGNEPVKFQKTLIVKINSK